MWTWDDLQRMPAGAGQDFARSLPEPRPERGDEMAHVRVAGHGRHGSHGRVRIPQQGPGALQTLGACDLEDGGRQIGRASCRERV